MSTGRLFELKRFLTNGKDTRTELWKQHIVNMTETDMSRSIVLIRSVTACLLENCQKWPMTRDIPKNVFFSTERSALVVIYEISQRPVQPATKISSNRTFPSQWRQMTKNNAKKYAKSLSIFVICCGYMSVTIKYDDVIKWKHFPWYWPFVRGIHWSPVTRSFDVFFDLRLNKRLSK